MISAVTVLGLTPSSGDAPKPPKDPAPAVEHGPFLLPASGKTSEPVWGLRGGIAVGLWTTTGPRGLLRIYAPYLGQPPRRMINFVAVEPIVGGRRGLSELEPSRRGGGPGKAMWSSDAMESASGPRDPWDRPAAGRIEEVVRKSEQEIEDAIAEAGQKAIFDVGVHGVHPEIIKLLGRLKYRYSYAQNVLLHSIEAAFICGAMAAELGLNEKQARRAALLTNAFVDGAARILDASPVNAERRSAGKLPGNLILTRDGGDRLPSLEPIRERFGSSWGCFVEMPVERGIALLLAVMMLGLVSAMVATALELSRSDHRIGRGVLASAQAPVPSLRHQRLRSPLGQRLDVASLEVAAVGDVAVQHRSDRRDVRKPAAERTFHPHLRVQQVGLREDHAAARREEPFAGLDGSRDIEVMQH